MSRAAARDAQPFGERFAWRMVGMFAGMALMLVAGTWLGGRGTPLAAVLIALPLTYGFRWRAASDEVRPGRALEDERDAAIRARADVAFRRAASCWFGALALGLSFDASRALLAPNGYAVPALLLLGLVVANIAGHATVGWRYRQDRA